MLKYYILYYAIHLKLCIVVYSTYYVVVILFYFSTKKPMNDQQMKTTNVYAILFK